MTLGSGSVGAGAAAPVAGARTPVVSASKKRYTPLELLFGPVLGEGSFALVYYARAKTELREFAVKVMDKDFIKREKKAHFVMTEKSLMSTLNHPNIVKLSFSFQDATRLYIGMELCNGELLKVIRHFVMENRAAGVLERGLPESLARLYLQQVASALQYLHFTAHIVHRDLKPENILIDGEGNVKITDFGTVWDEKLTDEKQNQFVGTAEYMAPELLQGEQVPTPAVDCWALGCVLFQMLVGRPPFRDPDSEYLTFEAVLEFARTRTLPLPDHVSEAAKSLLFALLEPDPTKRLGVNEASCADLLAHPFLAGEVAKPFILPRTPPPASALVDGANEAWDMLLETGGMA